MVNVLVATYSAPPPLRPLPWRSVVIAWLYFLTPRPPLSLLPPPHIPTPHHNPSNIPVHRLSALEKRFPLVANTFNPPGVANSHACPNRHICPLAPSTSTKPGPSQRQLRYMYSPQSHAFRLDPPPELQSFRSIRNPHSLHHCTNG
jgi:hypothetical protein